MYIWLRLCQILTDSNNVCTAETGKMYKTGHAFTSLLHKDIVANERRSRCGTNWSSLLWTMPSTNRGVVCRPVSTLKADIWNITYDCYAQNNNVRWENCKFDNWRWLSLFSFAVNVNERKRITEKCCYWNLRTAIKGTEMCGHCAWVVVKRSENDRYRVLTPKVRHWQTSSQSSVMTHR